jgi:hypothetical protein
MCNNKPFWEHFLDFEKRKNLFGMQDSEGTYFWDIIRGDIYFKLLWKNIPTLNTSKNKKQKISFYRRIVKDFFRLFFLKEKKRYFFFMASRYKNKEGIFFDQSIKNIYDLFSKKDSIVIESYTEECSKDSFFSPYTIFRKFIQSKKYDFTFLMNLLREEFGNLNFDNSFLNKIMDNYYSDLYFYKKILKKYKIEKIFICQNGIQKGLFRAGKELGIKIYETQHGSVDIGHLVYHYPSMEYTQKQISLPDVIFSFSPFWFKELNLPNVSICPVGNNYLYAPFEKKKNIHFLKEGITIISADIYGKILSDFILSEEVRNVLREIPIYFKLHPNQYHEKEYYIQKFEGIQNITVVSNEQSIEELLNKSNTIFTIVSTVIYEALQANHKVIILKRENYLEIEHIFNCPNVHLIDTINDFISALTTEIVTDPNTVFFAPFDKETFLETL